MIGRRRILSGKPKVVPGGCFPVTTLEKRDISLGEKGEVMGQETTADLEEGGGAEAP